MRVTSIESLLVVNLNIHVDLVRVRVGLFSCVDNGSRLRHLRDEALNI